MHRTKRILMVAFVATALSADRAGAARLAQQGPSYDPPMADTARRLAGRLARAFRRTLGAARLRMLPRSAARAIKPTIERRPADASLFVSPPLLGPFRFRLPPPAAHVR